MTFCTHTKPYRNLIYSRLTARSILTFTLLLLNTKVSSLPYENWDFQTLYKTMCFTIFGGAIHTLLFYKCNNPLGITWTQMNYHESPLAFGSLTLCIRDGNIWGSATGIYAIPIRQLCIRGRCPCGLEDHRMLYNLFIWSWPVTMTTQEAKTVCYVSTANQILY